MKLLILSSGTGGGEMFHILSEFLLKEKQLTVFNVSITQYAKKANPKSMFCTDALTILALRPDVVIYETSNACVFRDELLALFKNRCLLVSIMDVFDLDNRRFKTIVPDLICTPTKSIEEDMRLFGYENVWTYTNPAFSSLLDFGNKTIKPSGQMNILYAGEPLPLNVAKSMPPYRGSFHANRKLPY